MNHQIIEALKNSSDEELKKIVSNIDREFNQQTVTYAREILEDRGVDLTDIPTESDEMFAKRMREKEIKTLKSKANIRLILGICTTLLSVLLLAISGALFIVPTLLAITSIYLYLKYKRLANDLAANQSHDTDDKAKPELTLVKELQDAIIYAKNGDRPKLEKFLSEQVSVENFNLLHTGYQKTYKKDFVEEIKKMSNQYATIKALLQPLIDKNLLAPKYPHNRINTSR
ncbi:MAG: hypothetical protein EBR30_15735 [Cytophagia bacterium]|nr:hypothetical protein [Cytophagia bacterium]